MMDIKTVLDTHESKDRVVHANSKDLPTVSEIPDLFFDEILVEFKLSRTEILLIMYLYRQVWCKPNMYRRYGISPMLSHEDLAKKLCISRDDVYSALRKLEDLGFIETIRSGQYFVRKYFIQSYDETYGQEYDCE